jgi:hypothetical protein
MEPLVIQTNIKKHFPPHQRTGIADEGNRLRPSVPAGHQFHDVHSLELDGPIAIDE